MTHFCFSLFLIDNPYIMDFKKIKKKSKSTHLEHIYMLNLRHERHNS